MFDDLKSSSNKDVVLMMNLALQSADNERFISSGMNALTSALSFLNNKTIAKLWNILPMLASVGNKAIVATQSGSLRGYAASFGLGMAVLLVLVMMTVV